MAPRLNLIDTNMLLYLAPRGRTLPKVLAELQRWADSPDAEYVEHLKGLLGAASLDELAQTVLDTAASLRRR